MSPLSRLRVLVTEDEPDTLDLLEIILDHAHCEVVRADNPYHALELAQTETFDLYLLDNWMTEMSGVELCRKLREVSRQTPVLFYSGAAYDKDKKEAFAAGAGGYVVKPCLPGELVSEILRLTSRND